MHSVERNTGKPNTRVGEPPSEGEPQPNKRLQLRPFLGPLVFIANLLAAYVAIAPLGFMMPDYGLDASWKAVLGEASAHDWRFGRDIIFSNGPLAALSTHWLQLDHLGRNLAAHALLIVVFALLVTSLAWINRTIFAGYLVALGTTFCLLTERDAIFVAYPLLVSLLVLSPQEEILEKLSAALGLFCSALLTLVKFVVAPAAFVAFILCDCGAIIRRRWPVYTVTYLVLYFALFGWLEGPESFLQYVFDSIDIASGYSEAMSLGGSVRELLIFVAAAAVLLGALALGEARSMPQAGAIPWTALLRWLVAATYVFTMFKEGFVRHDQHSTLGWSGLAIAALVYPLCLRRAGLVSNLLCPAIAAASIIAIPTAFSQPLTLLETIPVRLEQQLTLAFNFIMAPQSRVAEWKQAKEEAWTRVRAVQKMPQVDGSVDIIPSLQSSLLAHGLDYRPRYSFQEYATYTGRLIEANRRDLVENGPDFLLFQPGSIDNRFPAMAEGPLWPHILANYEPLSEDGALLLLRRRTTVSGALLGSSSSAKVSFGDALELPDGPQFMRAEIKKTFLGNLVDLLFRPPLIQMRVALSDGTERSYRLIPAIAGAGFLVSPLVTTPRDFSLLSAGQTESIPSIRRLTLETSAFGRYVYAAQVDISLSSLSLDVLQRASARLPPAASGGQRR